MVAISINGEPVEFQLEQEKTLHDVVSSLERWLNEREQICTALEIDGQRIDPSDRVALLQRPLGSVGGVNLITASLSQVESESSVEIMHYLARFHASLADGSEEVYTAEAREGLRWAAGSLRLLAAIHHIDLDSFPDREKAISTSISALEQAAANLEAAPAERAAYHKILSGSFESLPQEVYEFLLMINKSIQDEENIPLRIQELRQAFMEYAGRTESISADLQTGDEARAMSHIQQTVFLLEELVRLAQKVERCSAISLDNIQSGGEPMPGWLEKVTQTGRDVIAAFNEKDTILLGDLFEYEIKEELVKVPDFLDGLLKQLSSGDG